MNRVAVSHELVAIARLLSAATGDKGTLSYSGRMWSVRWKAQWPNERNGGEILDRELRDKVDEVQKDIQGLTGAKFENVRPVGYACMGHAGLVGEVSFRESSTPQTRVTDFFGEFLDYMRGLGYRTS